MSAYLSVEEGGGSLLCEQPLKSVFPRRWKSRQLGWRTQGKTKWERGLRLSRLLSQKPLKFDSPTLNKSTDHPSLPFFQVWGSYQRTPTPTLPLAPSFLSLARILTSFFFPLLTQKRVGIMSSPSYLWSHDGGNESNVQVLPSTSQAFHLILFKSLWFFFFISFFVGMCSPLPFISIPSPPTHYSSDRGRIFFNRAL